MRTKGRDGIERVELECEFMQSNLSIIARTCVALFVAASGQVAFSQPGYAASPTTPARPAPAASSSDLSVQLTGLQLNPSIRRKVITTTVTNHGPSTARGIVVKFSGWVDSETVDPGTVNFCRPPWIDQQTRRAGSDPQNPRNADIGHQCKVPDLRAGQSVKLYSRTLLWAGVHGSIGELAAVVSHAGVDPVTTNNSAGGRIMMRGGRGVDLYARVSDVPTSAAGKVGAVVPGNSAELRYEIGNNGSLSARGLKVQIELPRHVTFAESRSDCVYDPAGRTATCVYRKLLLIPVQNDEKPGDDLHSAVRFTHRLRVSVDAPAPGYLAGGVLIAEPIDIESKPEVAASTVLPDGVTGLRGVDLDGSDNEDRFTVFTGRPGGAGGGLPVTGAPAGLLGGIGLASVLVGGALVLATRRRRQPPQTPGDGPSTG
ncbi:hypothetical protein GCM10027290_53180 [Micromonospora sonneratiae]